jgi:hypothetical protein
MGVMASTEGAVDFTSCLWCCIDRYPLEEAENVHRENDAAAFAAPVTNAFGLTDIGSFATPRFVDLNGDGDTTDSNELEAARAKYNREYRSVGWTSGIFKSFNDAPDGFKEELKEFTYSIGTEYWYKDAFALRLGYFNESEQKGKRKYFTLGAGFKYNVVGLDVSYLFSTSKVPNPLENTLRFSLTFNFGDDYDEY